MRRLLFALALLAPVFASAQTASIEPLPEGFEPRDISADGRSIIGDLVDADGTREGVLWRDGSLTVLRPSDLDANSYYHPRAISADGTTVVGGKWVWQDGTFEVVDVSGAGLLGLSDVSGDGSVIVGQVFYPEELTSQGLIVRDGVVTLVPLPGGIRPGNPLWGVSEDGTTIAGIETYRQVVPVSIPPFQDERDFYNGFFLYEGARIDIAPTLDSPDYGGSTQIWTRLPANDQRSVVVYEFTSIDMKSQARWRVWRPDGIRALPAPPGLPPHPSCTVNCAGLNMQVRATSASGERLGGSAGNDDGSRSFATLWDGLRPRRLADALSDAGADLTGWTLNTVVGISSSGQHLIGDGTYNGTRRTWRAVLPVAATWADATDGAFDDPVRWAPEAVPDAATPVFFDAVQGEDAYTVAFDQDHTLATLTVSAPPGQGFATPVTFDLEGYTLTLSPQAEGVDALLVADQADGELLLSGGALHAAAGVTLGRAADASGRLAVLDGHALTVEGPLVVGDGGTGATDDPSTLTVSEGSTVEARAGFDVGLQAETAGYVYLGPDVILQVPSASVSTVGFAGDGRLVADGAFVSHTGPLTLGRLAGSSGRVDLVGLAGAPPSNLLVTDSVVVGLAGEGMLSVTDGSGLTTGPAVIGAAEGGVGEVRLAGAGSEWVVAGDLRNGANGTGVLEVVEGARLCTSGVASTGPEGRFVTDGTLRLGYGDCTAAPRTGDGLARQGGSSVALGGLAVAAGGTVEATALDVGPDGTLDGAGDLAVPVTNGGTLAPGGADALGTLALAAAFAQTADGVLAIEVGTDGADRLTVEGAVTLGGTLRVSALPGSTPTVGATYDVLTATAFTGTFERFEAQEGLSVSVGATAVTVSVTSVVTNEDEALPATLALRAYPNPIATTAMLTYDLPTTGLMRLALYDVLGRQVAVLADGARTPGSYEVPFDAADLPSGMYVARLDAGGATLTRRLTVVR